MGAATECRHHPPAGGRFADALLWYDRLIQRRPRLAGAVVARGWMGKGGGLLGQDRYGAALAAFEQGLNLKPTPQVAPILARGYALQAAALTALRRDPEALAACEQALRLSAGQEV